MTLQQAMEKNPYDCNKGNLSAYARYIRYNVDGMYNMKSKDVQNLILQKISNDVMAFALKNIPVSLVGERDFLRLINGRDMAWSENDYIQG